MSQEDLQLLADWLAYMDELYKNTELNTNDKNTY
jgi:hypothetical protein